MVYLDYKDKQKHNKTYYQQRKEGTNDTRNTAWIKRRLRNLIAQGIIIPEIEEEK